MRKTATALESLSCPKAIAPPFICIFVMLTSTPALVVNSDVAYGAEAASQPLPTVVVEAVQMKETRAENTYSARVEAIDKLHVKARVEGFLVNRNFEEGAEVKKGQLLFEIEPRAYEIAVAEAEASLASANADLADANATYTRTLDLQQRQISTDASLSSAKSRFEQAKAKSSIVQAQLAKAKLDLSYTQITAPFSGRIGRAAISVGEFVNAASGPLAVLVAQDPMYVAIPLPQPMLAKLLMTEREKAGVSVELRHADGSLYEHKGTISFVDNEAIAATHTVMVRATIPNPERRLVDQQLIEATLVDDIATKILAISQSAVMLDQLGSYVLALDKDNRVEVRRIELGRQHGSLIAVRTGLSEGDRVIVSGHLKAQPGMLVTPQIADASVAIPQQASAK